MRKEVQNGIRRFWDQLCLGESGVKLWPLVSLPSSAVHTVERKISFYKNVFKG